MVHTTNSLEQGNGDRQATFSRLLRWYLWWLQMAIYTLFVLSGQSAGTLLGRLYFEKGGRSKWLATLLQNVGFPILLPLLFNSKSKYDTEPIYLIPNQPSIIVLAIIYISLGVFQSATSMLYSIGIFYLPVSTFSLVCASQLAFNSLFSFLINAQKFTPSIVNSIVILTVSSTLLVFQNDTGESTEKAPKGKHAVGLLSTVCASAGYAFLLSMTQFFYQRIIRRETFRVVLDTAIYLSLVASCVVLAVLFISGEGMTLREEMERFELGKVSYVMTLVWTAVSWQVFNIGCVGLIFNVSSLFCNVISTLGLPIPPALAVIFFHEKMNALKIIALVLAVWGFVSYLYQHYLDDQEDRAERDDEMSDLSFFERG